MADTAVTSVEMELARSAERRLVLEHVAHHDRPRTIVLQGPQGIGKAWLMTEIVKDIAGTVPGAVVVSMNGGYPRDAAETLLSIRRGISVDAGRTKRLVKFLAFDTAMYAYVKKMNGRDEANKLAVVFSGLSDGLFRKMLRKAGKVAGLAVGGEAVTETARETVDVAREYLDELLDGGIEKMLQYLKDWEAFKNSKVGAQLSSLDALTPDEIVVLLPGFLSWDIEQFLKESLTNRVVVTCVGYDDAWTGRAPLLSAGHFGAIDALEALVDVNTNALFLISDRSAAAWSDVADPAQRDRTLVPLSLLSESAASLFLERLGFSVDLRTAVVEQSEGLPLWLAIAAQQFGRLSKLGRRVTPVDLILRSSEVIDRVSVGLEKSELQTLKQLSTVPWFDDELFRLIVSEPFATGYPVEGLRTFSEFAFVQSVETDQFAIHPAFRKPIDGWMRKDDADLVNRLAVATREHLSRSGSLGKVRLLIGGHDLVRDVLRAVMDGRLPAEQFLDVLSDERIESAHQAGKALHAELDNFQRILAELQDGLSKYSFDDSAKDPKTGQVPPEKQG